MLQDIIIPKVGETSSTVRIARWLKTEGQRVRNGEAVIEVDTDKSTLEIEALADGVLESILLQEGDEASELQVVGRIRKHAAMPGQHGSAPDATHALPPLVELYRRMFRIRSFERKVNEYFLRGLIPGTVHLSIGQESVAVGVAAALRADDTLIPTHRGHGHALAKGMLPYHLFAELFARKDGCCGGKGGSLHISDVSKGIMPPNPVVGSSVPYAAGIAFSYRYRRQDRVIASIFGDGAINTGPLHEGINLAAIWDLPVVFVCENNQYAISTHIKAAVRNTRLSDRAAAYGIPGTTVDGNDVEAVLAAMQTACAHARAGHGPSLIECVTYRHGGHKRDDAAAYRPQAEVTHWLSQDGLPRLAQKLLAEAHLNADQLHGLETEIERELSEAAEAALCSPPADVASIMSDVYA